MSVLVTKAQQRLETMGITASSFSFVSAGLECKAVVIDVYVLMGMAFVKESPRENENEA